MNTGRKISLNLVLGIASELLSIILGIIVPRLILTSYGSETNGLLSSVTQIYSYVALLEAGIGTATIQALYKTLGKENKAATNAVLAATNRYYHRTGFLYLLAILLFSIIYPLVVSTDIPTITVVLVIIFNGIGSVINYFFQAKYFLLLQAEGKNYVQTALGMFTNVFKNIAKIVLMASGCNVVFVQAIAMFISMIQMIYITRYIKKNYSWIDLSVQPDFKAISQSKNVLVHQISGLIYNNTDSITLTIFCGLKIVSIYSMYTMLFGMISTALSTVSSSFIFSLGQTFHIDKKRFMKMYDAFELYYMTLVFALYSIANYFILPFMRLYTAGVSDINYIDKKLPLLFISISLLSCGRSAANQVINFAGHFKLTQNRAIAEAAINLVTSVVAVQFWGIYGVLIGTIAALLYRSNDIILYANRRILQRSVWMTYKRWVVNLTTFFLILCLNHFLNFNIDSYGKLFLICIPYTILTLIIFFTVSSLFERQIAKYTFRYILSKVIKNEIS
ncbi:MAG: sugar isomerase [Ruminococcus sp.]|nr:sugar isomerase [Ruminococcus sp.]